MQARIWSLAGVALCVLASVGGCGGDDDDVGAGTAAQCAGTYAGTYTGDATGTLDGTLDADGAIEVTFTATGSTSGVSGTGQLGDGGSIALAVGGNEVSGHLDAQCNAVGTWSYPGFGSGSWQMLHQNP